MPACSFDEGQRTFPARPDCSVVRGPGVSWHRGLTRLASPLPAGRQRRSGGTLEPRMIRKISRHLRASIAYGPRANRRRRAGSRHAVRPPRLRTRARRGLPSSACIRPTRGPSTMARCGREPFGGDVPARRRTAAGLQSANSRETVEFRQSDVILTCPGPPTFPPVRLPVSSLTTRLSTASSRPRGTAVLLGLAMPCPRGHSLPTPFCLSGPPEAAVGPAPCGCRTRTRLAALSLSMRCVGQPGATAPRVDFSPGHASADRLHRQRCADCRGRHRSLLSSGAPILTRDAGRRSTSTTQTLSSRVDGARFLRLAERHRIARQAARSFDRPRRPARCCRIDGQSAPTSRPGWSPRCMVRSFPAEWSYALRAGSRSTQVEQYSRRRSGVALTTSCCLRPPWPRTNFRIEPVVLASRE
jgi:hypothetical protein